jgi:hypothetical protein
MKSKDDHFTSDLYGNRPGRPRKLNAKNDAQRAREYRQRKQNESISVTTSRNQNYGIDGVGQLGRKD